MASMPIASLRACNRVTDPTTGHHCSPPPMSRRSQGRRAVFATPPTDLVEVECIPAVVVEAVEFIGDAVEFLDRRQTSKVVVVEVEAAMPTAVACGPFRSFLSVVGAFAPEGWSFEPATIKTPTPHPSYSRIHALYPSKDFTDTDLQTRIPSGVTARRLFIFVFPFWSVWHVDNLARWRIWPNFAKTGVVKGRSDRTKRLTCRSETSRSCAVAVVPIWSRIWRRVSTAFVCSAVSRLRPSRSNIRRVRWRESRLKSQWTR